ncbi:hypothetical protein GCM10022251_26610 [Phytohabitans flavus]|uniref:Uncharacterized protein n=1 Tax=Phytohabitans flavus TaxID=1076124 RepID=A0A6F8XPH5_9ACTN|nr:hypothetical protein Pflav_021520 [Phytohabitans flavus]
MGGTLNGQPLTVPPVQVLGPGDVIGLDRAQVIRTDPVPGATGFDTGQYATVDFDSPTLPWLFTPRPPDGDRLAPWLCLIVVPQQRGVSLSVNARLGIAELTISGPTDAAAVLPDLANAWAWAHVQYAGDLDPGQTLGQAIAKYPERSVSRLVCPTRLDADVRYHACVVPTFAIGRDAGLGRPLGSTLAPAWTAADHQVTLPVYHHWEFTTGAGARFVDLVRALRFRTPPAGIGERPFDVSQSGLTTPAGATMPPLVGALCGFGTEVDPAPQWARQALAPMVGAATGLPLYGGEQAGATAVPANDPGWLGELNLDPRHRAVAALGAAVVRDRQEDLAAAAWEQAGEVSAANELVGSARFGARMATSRLDRHITGLATSTLAQFVTPLQRAAAADPESSNAYRRITRPRGPFAAKVQPTTLSTSDGVRAAAAATGGERDALLALLSPQTAVHDRLRRRLGAIVPETRAARAAAAATDGEPVRPVLVAPTIPTAMAPELARVAPQFLLPGADDIEADSVLALQTNPHFVAAFLAGVNAELASELRWRQYPLDGTATPIQQFWDRRGQGGGAAASPDIEGMASWDRADGLAGAFRGASATAQVVLLIRGGLLRHFPRTAVYMIRAADPDHLADERNAANVAYPIFSGALEPDIRFFGFPISTTDAAGGATGPGWFFALSEQPTETRFGPPPSDPRPPTQGAASAAEVAERTLRPPVRVIVHASTLLATEPVANGENS